MNCPQCLVQLVLILPALAVAGCGGSEIDQQTPRATIEKMFDAGEQGDAPRFLACFDADEHQRRVLEAIAETNAAVRELRLAVVDHHGEEGWKLLSDIIRGFRYGIRPDLENLRIEEKDDAATATMPGGGRPMKLARSDGVWKIVPEKIAGGGEESQRLARFFRARAEAVRAVVAGVGQHGVDLNTIRRRLLAEMGKKIIQH